jgi:hypothetical protein
MWSFWAEKASLMVNSIGWMKMGSFNFGGLSFQTRSTRFCGGKTYFEERLLNFELMRDTFSCAIIWASIPILESLTRSWRRWYDSSSISPRIRRTSKTRDSILIKKHLFRAQMHQKPSISKTSTTYQKHQQHIKNIDPKIWNIDEIFPISPILSLLRS